MPRAPGPAGRKLSAGLDAGVAPSPTHPPREAGGHSRLLQCLLLGLQGCAHGARITLDRLRVAGNDRRYHPGVLASCQAHVLLSSALPRTLQMAHSPPHRKRRPRLWRESSTASRGGVWIVCPPASLHAMPSTRHALPTPMTAEPMLSSPARRFSG